MAQAAVSEDQFIELWNVYGSNAQMAEQLGISIRNVQARRNSIQNRRKIILPDRKYQSLAIPDDNIRVPYALQDGVIVVVSDCHYWPGEITTAHRGVCHVLQTLGDEVKLMVVNGDFLDGATISRHPKRVWDILPSMEQEIEVGQDRLGEIQASASSKTRLIRTIGNHDMRYDGKLATAVPEFQNIPGMKLADHFPDWPVCNGIMVNDNTMIKHRWHSGMHALWNNVLKAGISMVTGHRHALDRRRFRDYRGTRYAVDTGTLAAVDGPQFQYTEDCPLDWQSGFVALPYRNGVLMPPELIEVVDDDYIWFRGHKVRV